MKTESCQGQPSWSFSSDKVEALITRQGGHLAPVRFRLGRRMIEPFSIAPWAEEKSLPGEPRIQRLLRGDFFCAPFGADEKTRSGEERHPPHGEVANEPWKFVSLQKSIRQTELRLSLKTKIRPGRADKLIRLRQGETAIYCRHVLSGMAGRMNFGHHAMLKFPETPGSGLLSSSPLQFGQVLPVPFEDPALGGYSSLKAGAVFSRLDRVPMANGIEADLSLYPARRGFEDLAMIVHQARPDFAWTAVSFPRQGYVWFSLKDPRVLQSTVLWLSNGGRHYPPWNGRHICVMGVEEVTSYFHCGLGPSIRPNSINRRGFRTFVKLDPKKPLVVNYIMAVAAIPAGFTRVKTVEAEQGEVTLISEEGKRASLPLQTDFLYQRP